jgi:hypothetical protein
MMAEQFGRLVDTEPHGKLIGEVVHIPTSRMTVCEH